MSPRNSAVHHIYITGAFSPEHYRRLLGMLPATAAIASSGTIEATQANGRSARRKFYPCPEHIVLPPAEQRAFWLDLSRVFRSRALQNTFKRKFCATLEQRSGRDVSPSCFVTSRAIGSVFSGDSLDKAITVQFYLPRDEAQDHLGTALRGECPASRPADRLRGRGPPPCALLYYVLP